MTPEQHEPRRIRPAPSGAVLVHTPPKIGVLDVIAHVCRKTGVSKTEIIGGRRTKGIALARQIVMYRCVKETSASLVRIGGLLGDRDHTTISHGRDRVAGLWERGELPDEYIPALRGKIKPATRGKFI